MIYMIVFLCTFLTACGVEDLVMEEPIIINTEIISNSEQGHLTLSMGKPTTFNPLLNERDRIDRILKMIYLPLISIDQHDRPSPSIAESWIESADGLSVTMQLKTGLLWSNGTPITVDDIIYSFQTITKASEDSMYKNTLKYVRSITKINDTSFEVRFYENFSGNMMSLNFPIISQNYHQTTTAEAGLLVPPMGSGAYKMESYTQASHMILIQNPYYQGSTGEIQEIYVKITDSKETDLFSFEQGMIDVFVTNTNEAGQNVNKGNGIGYTFMSREYDFIGFNFNRSLFQDKSIRQAVAYATPKEYIVESVYLNAAQLTNTPVHPNSWLYEENIVTYAYDLNQASLLLKNAGWSDINGDKILEKYIGGIPTNLGVSILVNADSTTKMHTAQALKDELSLLGFDVFIDAQPFEIYEEKFKSGQYDLVLATWKMSEAMDLSSIFHSNGSLNYTSYIDIETDILLESAYRAIGELETKMAYSNLQQRLASELPYVSLAYQHQTLFTSNRVGGIIHPNVENVFYTIQTWTYGDNKNNHHKTTRF